MKYTNEPTEFWLNLDTNDIFYSEDNMKFDSGYDKNDETRRVVLYLEKENLSALIRKMVRFAKTRSPEEAREKIIDLYSKAEHLLTPISALRAED